MLIRNITNQNNINYLMLMRQYKGRKIIVSADDFGISQKASGNILELAKRGLVDRVEIMISDNITKDYVQKLLSSGVKIDIHFHLEKNNLDRWQDGSREIEKSIIKRGLMFFYSYFLGKGIPKRVEKEWEDQILEFIKLFGKNPDGASSHEHIHFFSVYFKIMMKLCKKYNIGYVRIGKQKIKIPGSRISAILDYLKRKDINFFERQNINTSDFMVSFDWLSGNFDQFVASIPENKSIEIVFHPEIREEFNFLRDFNNIY